MRAHLWQMGLAITVALFFQQARADRAKVVYGADDRLDYYQVTEDPVKRLADATVALIRAANITDAGTTSNIHTVPYGPARSLCASEPFYKQSTAANCSGFLVNADTIVTAGHCIWTQQDCEETRFVFGFKINKEDDMPKSVPTEQVFKCKELVTRRFTPHDDDFAVIKLDRAVTYASPLAVRNSGSIAVGEGLRVIGYPFGLPVKIAAGANVLAVQARYLTANTDTYDGNSGSPIFNAVTGNVEAILVNGNPDWDLQNGCYVSKKCANDGHDCKGEDATLIERVLPYIK